MNNITVTGSRGFVGANLMPYLNSSFEQVSIIDRELLSNISTDDIKNAEVIIHLAGKAHDIKKVSAPEAYYAVNFDLTKKLFDTFLKSDATKFIFISSVKAAADIVKGTLKEDMIACPQTHYGKSKLMAEEYIRSQPLPEGKSYFILRPCMIHGSGNKGNLNLLYKVVRMGIPYPLAGFSNKRSFLSIENLCFIIRELIARNDIPSGIYQVADDEALSTNEVVSILSSSLKKSVKLWKIPPSLIKFIAVIGDRLHLPLTTERLDKLTESYVVSNEKIKKAINKPLPLSAKEGLILTTLSFENIRLNS